MEEIGRRHLRNAGIAAAAVAYFFAFARPLPRELALEPTWAARIGGASRPAPASAPQAASASEAALPFRFGRLFGYVTESGRMLFAAETPYGASLSRRSWIAYDRLPEKLELRAPSGRSLATLTEAGYPFFDEDRLYLLSPGQSGVARLSESGATLWKRDFPSIVTAFDSSPELSLFGLLDGGLVAVGPKGEALLDFAPGGSRLPGVYGCAVSPDGSRLAAVTGLDPQRLVLMERRSSAYRVAWHRDLGSDYRGPVGLAFSGDGRLLVFERPGGLGILDVERGAESFLRGGDFSSLGMDLPDQGLLGAIEKGDAPAFVLSLPEGERVLTARFTGTESFALREGSSLYLGAVFEDAAAGGAKPGLADGPPQGEPPATGGASGAAAGGLPAGGVASLGPGMAILRIDVREK